jgi:hypothetical protein
VTVLYTRNAYQTADSGPFHCFVAVWIRRIIIVATTRLTTIRAATTGEIIAPIWDVVVTVGEVVTGPRHQRTVTRDTLTWLLSMYCSGARVGAPICPGMGVVLVMCSSCTFNKRDPVNCMVSKKSQRMRSFISLQLFLFICAVLVVICTDYISCC